MATYRRELAGPPRHLSCETWKENLERLPEVASTSTCSPAGQGLPPNSKEIETFTWCTTLFRSLSPEYPINSTAMCYYHQAQLTTRIVMGDRVDNRGGEFALSIAMSVLAVLAAIPISLLLLVPMPAQRRE